MADYNFSDYLDKVPEYQQTKTSAEMLAQAKAASNLAFDPIRQEAERQRKFNEMQQYNTMNLDRNLLFPDQYSTKLKTMVRHA